MSFWPLPVGAWAGAHVGVTANGPSLECQPAASCDRWIAVNDSFRLFPFADLVYAADVMWWWKNGEEVMALCPDSLWVCGEREGNLAPDIKRIELAAKSDKTMQDDPSAPLIPGGFSGYQATQIAWALGAAHISLHGFDCKTIKGNSRWFGGHDAGEIEKMALIGPTWEKKITELMRELRKRGIAVDRILSHSGLRAGDIGTRATG